MNTRELPWSIPSKLSEVKVNKNIKTYGYDTVGFVFFIC